MCAKLLNFHINQDKRARNNRYSGNFIAKLEPFITLNNRMRPILESGGKEIGVASLLEAQFAAQLVYAGGEVATGQVGLLDVGEQCLELFLAKVAPCLYLKGAAGEGCHELFAGEEMAHGM